MSKLTWLLSIAAVAGVLSGCGGGDSGDDQPPQTTPRTETTPARPTRVRETPARDLEYVDLQGVAVSAKGRLSEPYAVAVDQAGAVYIADKGNGRVRRVDPGGAITTILP